MIKKYSLKALQKAINHAMALDDSMPAKIAALHGKVIEIIIIPLDSNFFISFEQEQLILLDEYPDKPDTIIHSSPLGLIKLSFLPASQARSLFNEKIRLSGDTELGQKIKQLFDELDIDWESQLAHFTGDVVAYQLGSWFRQGLEFKKQLDESMRHNIRDYLQEELRVLPAREEIEDFFHDIDKLSADVERMQAQYELFSGLMAAHEIN